MHKPSERTLFKTCPSSKLKSTASTTRTNSIKRRKELSSSFGTLKLTSSRPSKSKRPEQKSRNSRGTVYPRVLINLDEVGDVAEENSTPGFCDLNRSVCGNKFASGTASGLRQAGQAANNLSMTAEKP